MQNKSNTNPVPGDIVDIHVTVRGIIERDGDGLYVNVQQQNIPYNGELVNIVAHAMPESMDAEKNVLKQVEQSMEQVRLVMESAKRHGILGINDYIPSNG